MSQADGPLESPEKDSSDGASGILTAQEAAAELRVHEKTVRRMCGRGDIPAVRVAGRWRIRRADLPTEAPPRRRSGRTPRNMGRLSQIARELTS